MSKYKISGVWKNDKNVITHYAIHTVTDQGTTRAEKVSKADAISLLETRGNTAVTTMWNYRAAQWNEGEVVHIVDGRNGKFLRSDADNQLTDNLEHLIDYDWIVR